ncbi:MAG: hypothetical protein QOJ09_3069 [Actinomycetota bacterium]|nr:hypothetical protein [Actinomycetota bacterium]
MPELVDDTDVRSDDPVTPEERQQTVRLLLRLAAAGLAVIIAAGVSLLLTRDNGNKLDFGGKVTLVNSIGPLSGRDVQQYVLDRQHGLDAATGVRAAVVSLASYMKEPDARRLVEGLNVRALIVAAPGGRPTVVAGDLAAWADKARQEAASERIEFEHLLPTYDSKEEKDFLDDAKAQIARLQRVEQAASAGGDVVFGVVLVAPADQLQRLAKTTGVRLVDVGTGPAVPALSRVRGIRPEEVTTSGDPLTRPA